MTQTRHPAPTPVLLPDVTEVVDLTDHLRSLGTGDTEAFGATDPARREQHRGSVAELDDDGACLDDVAAADVSAWVDGIQSASTVAWRAGRPVVVVYVAAGAVTSDGHPIACKEQLVTICSAADSQSVRSVSKTPVVTVDETAPPDVPGAVHDRVRELRDGLERRVASELLARTDGVVVVDGSVVGRERSRRIAGVVKTVDTRYLSDESALFTLAEGHRSVRFRIDENVADDAALPGRREGQERVSAYVRLWGADGRRWDHGLVRVETADPDLVDGIAAAALGQRQTNRTGDPRWDRHVAPVAEVERFLRARRPGWLGS